MYKNIKVKSVEFSKETDNFFHIATITYEDGTVEKLKAYWFHE